MTRNRIALLGSAFIGAVLLCGAGAANAQPYDSRYDNPYIDDRPAPATETVIVHPDYDFMEKRQLVGRVGGEVDPVETTISRPVSFADLDLSRDADLIELGNRVHQTAADLCAELDARDPALRGDPSADRECVRTATRNAMEEVRERLG